MCIFKHGKTAERNSMDRPIFYDWGWCAKETGTEQLQILYLFCLALAPSICMGVWYSCLQWRLACFGMRLPSVMMAVCTVLQLICVEKFLKRLYTCIVNMLISLAIVRIHLFQRNNLFFSFCRPYVYKVLNIDQYYIYLSLNAKNVNMFCKIIHV